MGQPKQKQQPREQQPREQQPTKQQPTKQKQQPSRGILKNSAFHKFASWRTGAHSTSRSYTPGTRGASPRSGMRRGATLATPSTPTTRRAPSLAKPQNNKNNIKIIKIVQ